MTRPAPGPPQSARSARLRTLLIVLVTGAAWPGAWWPPGRSASTPRRPATWSAPASRSACDAQQMYRSLSDADVTATTAFLAGVQEPLATRQRYAADIARRAADLAALKGATGAAGSRSSTPACRRSPARCRSTPTTSPRLRPGTRPSYQSHRRLVHAGRVGGDAPDAAARRAPRLRAGEARGSAASSAQATGLPWIVGRADPGRARSASCCSAPSAGCPGAPTGWSTTGCWPRRWCSRPARVWLVSRVRRGPGAT